MYAAHAAWLLRKPHIALEDTGNMEQVRLYLPFSKVVLTSTSFHKDLGPKQIRYAGCHELSYLHPNYFQPDKKVLDELRLQPDEKYAIFRFISWNASHDKGQKGISLEMKRKLISLLEKKYRIFITSEASLPKDLEIYRLKTSPEKIHSLLAFASLVITEGATMASECAMLGTPAIYINSIYAGTINDQEKAGLLFSFKNEEGLIDKVNEFISGSLTPEIFRQRKELFLKDKIDVTAFLVWFVENYPDSADMMRKNPEYQLRFK
jgi:predicted glycosyltransferase